MKHEKDTLCLACGHKWHSRTPPDQNPYFDRTQCTKCYNYSVVAVKDYTIHLQRLRKSFTSMDIKKILEFFDFVLKNNYLKTRRGSEAKCRQLLQDLANPDATIRK